MTLALSDPASWPDIRGDCPSHPATAQKGEDPQVPLTEPIPAPRNPGQKAEVPKALAALSISYQLQVLSAPHSSGGGCGEHQPHTKPLKARVTWPNCAPAAPIPPHIPLCQTGLSPTRAAPGIYSHSIFYNIQVGFPTDHLTCSNDTG